MKVDLDLLHALFERRLTDVLIDVEYKDNDAFCNNSTVGPLHFTEPLHDNTPARYIEAVENLVKSISHMTNDLRSRIICTRLTATTAYLKIVVFEFEEMP